MQRGQRHALHRRWVAGVGAQFEFGDQRCEVELGVQRHLLVDQFGQRAQRFPAIPGLHTGGRFGGEAQRFQQGAHGRRDVALDAPVGSALQGYE